MKNKINQFLEENLIIILSLGLILIIVISLPLLAGQPEEKTQVLPTAEEQPSIFPSSALSVPSLSFSLGEGYTLEENTSFSLEVFPQEEISASVYRLEILFDPQVLAAEEVSAGSFFKNPQILRSEIDNQEGRIDFSAAIGLEEKIATDEPKSKAPLLTVTFRIKSSLAEEGLSSTMISFGEKTTLISGEKEFKNLGEKLEPIILKINTAHE